MHPWSRVHSVLGWCSVCFYLDSFQLGWRAKGNWKIAAGKSCFTSTEITISENGTWFPQLEHPTQVGEVPGNLLRLRTCKDRILLPVALGCFSQFTAQSWSLTERLNIVEKSVPALLNCKGKEPSQNQVALYNFYSNQNKKKSKRGMLLYHHILVIIVITRNAEGSSPVGIY